MAMAIYGYGYSLRYYGNGYPLCYYSYSLKSHRHRHQP